MSTRKNKQIKRAARFLGITEEQVKESDAVELLLKGLSKLIEKKKAEKEDADKEKDSEGRVSPGRSDLTKEEKRELYQGSLTKGTMTLAYFEDMYRTMFFKDKNGNARDIYLH